ncbi:MAG: glutathione synthase [Candidatus Sericytochromatia bacterium]|nr:glutathione synthase [Candidatus Sericytochromatia bacterium]
MPLKIAYVMDPIAGINIKKDSTFAMLEAAQARGHQNYYLLPEALYRAPAQADQPAGVRARMQAVQVQRAEVFYNLAPAEDLPLSAMDAVIMRKDPPFDMRYIYATYLLEQASGETLVLNRPDSLRNANEKLYALNFPKHIPRTWVGSDREGIKAFVAREGKAILKPIDAKGGEGVFVLRADDSNLSALLDLMTADGRQPVIVQQYIPEAKDGDIRVLMIDGEVQAAFRRVPQAGEHRANLNAGAQAVAYTLTETDRAVCAEVGAALRRDGLVFVGLDLIGGHLIEVNVTSPTGMQEALRLSGVDTATALIQWIETQQHGGQS